MKAIVIEEVGTIEGLVYKKDALIPMPKSHEIRVKVGAVSLNPSDFQTVEFMQEKPKVQTVLGLDVAGIVDEIGSDVLGFKKGERVVFLREYSNPNGGFAEYSCVDSETVVRIPDSMSFERAAALPGAGFTAYKALIEKMNVRNGASILIHGGAGGVGSYAIQLAKMKNMTIYTSCLGKDMQYVKGLGATEAIDFETENVHDRVLEMTNLKGVDYVLSTVGSNVATKDLEVLRYDGQMAVTSGFPDFDSWKFYDKQLTIHEIALGNALSHKERDIRNGFRDLGTRFVKLVADGEINTPVLNIIDLKQVPEYLKKMKQGKITGKVIATV